MLLLFPGADCHDVDDHHWINGYPTPVANPMSSYPRYKAQRKSWGINALGSTVVEVEAEDGTTGVGMRLLSLLFLKFVVSRFNVLSLLSSHVCKGFETSCSVVQNTWM